MHILVCNAGSTSLKFKVFEMPSEQVLAEAKLERIGRTKDAIFSYQNAASGRQIYMEGQSIPSYTEGIQLFLKHLLNPAADLGALTRIEEIDRVGFKTVLADGYYGVHVLDEKVMDAMRAVLDVAPAHNGPYLEVISQFKQILPDAVMVGAFETAFHTTIPLERRIYAIPYEWYEKYGFQRLGYHGASHSYIADAVTGMDGATGRLVSCHLGGSCSLCAIVDGKSVDTTFGYSLQTGIFHANRCGDVDPYIFPFLRNRGLSDEEILEGLAKQGGLLGISGVSNDLRHLNAVVDEQPRAKLAIDHFCNTIVKSIGAFYAEMGGLDRLVFTGGIGENAVQLRRQICAQLPHLGIQISDAENAKGRNAGVISTPDSKVKVFVIVANEELGVARKTYCAEAAG